MYHVILDPLLPSLRKQDLLKTRKPRNKNPENKVGEDNEWKDVQKKDTNKRPSETRNRNKTRIVLSCNHRWTPKIWNGIEDISVSNMKTKIWTSRLLRCKQEKPTLRLQR